MSNTEKPVYRCEVCGAYACFGQKWPASERDRWFCPKHKPDDYYGRKS